MKPKFIVNIFIIIVAATAIKGFLLIRQIDSKLEPRTENQKELVDKIGEIHDWYSITIAENLVKYSNSIYSFKDFQENISNSQKIKNESLKNFYNATPNSNQEFLLAQTLRDSDVKVDEFLNRVLKMDKRPSTQSISEMYQVMIPAIESSKEIIKLQKSFSKSNTQQLYETVCSFELFSLLTLVFSAAMFIAYNAPKSYEETSPPVQKKTVKSLVKKPKTPIKKIKITSKYLNS